MPLNAQIMPPRSSKGSLSKKWPFALIIPMVLLLCSTKVSGQIIFSFSYQNVTRVNGGGTLEPGDIIEIRALILVRNNISNVSYHDTIPAGTQYVPGSMKIVTNEGLLFDGPYTDAGGDDQAIYIPGADARLRVNLGSSYTNATTGNYNYWGPGGNISPGDLPKFYGGTMMVVAYRLLITGALGDNIDFNGDFWYRDGSNYTERLEYGLAKIQLNTALCENFSSTSFTAESSFGSGNLQNRPVGVNSPGYIFVGMAPNLPNDGKYAVANNTSANGSTNNGGPYKPASNPDRVFGGFWDIVGDHTGATDPDLGNPPVAPGTNGGYMLVVNAAFPTGEAYRDNIQNVCPNTYYEFSAWFRNICKVCGIDANSDPTYTPGVLPNLAFTINDVDYYNTGNIQWTGEWEKKGFIYKTGTTETSFDITIKNNAPGGGGNDWVLDDIKLATCYPNLIMNPSDTAKVCAGSMAVLSDTVISYFNNYNYYCWETSADGGITWTGTGVCGTKIPVLVNGLWQYVVDTVFTTVASDSGKLFRVKVATTAANLSNPDCSVDQSQEVYMQVFNVDCSILSGGFSNFQGILKNGNSHLSWNTTNETNVQNFVVEKSTDGIHFYSYSIVPPKYPSGGKYQFIDPQSVKGVNYYRIRIAGKGIGDNYKFSDVINLFNRQPLSIQMPNPFRSQLPVDIYAPSEGNVSLVLIDLYGKKVASMNAYIPGGNTGVVMESLASIPAGIYILRVNMGAETVQAKLVKQ